MSDPQSLSNELTCLSSALQNADARLQSETEPDVVALNRFRQALDNVRLTAWSVSELINARRSKKEPDKVLAFLSAERLRRLDQLVRNLCGDIERGMITSASYGMDSLFESINILQHRLARCLAEQERSNNSLSNGRSEAGAVK